MYIWACSSARKDIDLHVTYIACVCIFCPFYDFDIGCWTFYDSEVFVVYFIQGQSVILITRYTCFVDHCSSFSPFLPLYCLSFLHLRFLVTYLVSSHFYLNNMQTSHHQYIEKWNYKEGWRYQIYSIRLKLSCFLSGPIDKFSVDLLCLFAHSGAQHIFFSLVLWNLYCSKHYWNIWKFIRTKT